MLRTLLVSVSTMRSCVLILAPLAGFTLVTCAGLAVSPVVQVKEITVTVDNSTLRYPDSVVLVPGEYPDDQRRLLFHQLRHDVMDNQLTPQRGHDDVSKAVQSVLRAAALVLKADSRSEVDAKRGTELTHVYVVEAGEGESDGRRRRRRSVRLVRSAYTKQWQELCESCPALAPQQPVVINIIKTGSGCGNDCAPKPSSCGHPHCESNFPLHHPFMFHPPPPPPHHFHHHPPPPPPPPPHFHHYPPPPTFHHQPAFYTPSTTNHPANPMPKPMNQQPSQPARPQVMTPAKCDPCAAPASQPAAPLANNYGGSFSQSSASAQSSSFAWNG